MPPSKIVTPLSIIWVLLLAMIVFGLAAMDKIGYGVYALILAVPLFLISLVLDIIFRVRYKSNIKKLWLYECIAIVVLFFVLVAYLSAVRAE